MPKLPPLNALRAFEAAARHASVTQAAEELGVSHTAVSQQIRKLEHHLGQSLFHRNARRVEPTNAARTLEREVRAAFDRITLAAEQFDCRNGKVISVNATPSFAMRWLIPRSSKFQIENPAITVQIETSASDGIDHLARGYDFVFRRAPMERPEHGCLKILDDHSTAVLAPKLATSMDLKDPEDLRRSVLLHLKSRPDAWKQWFELSGQGSPDTPPGPYYEHFFLSLQATINGLGVAVGPLCLVEDDLAAGKLVAPFSEHILAGPGFHVLYPLLKMRSRHHRAFLEAIVAAAREANVS
ncbi:LysR substrate-binding domain-containing protein [Mesorhizobium sp.]|uniref:LysR substrate-binding domain-containing protein n=1 Tax=Mesorhizobium sp. TaxID=1871066 RepID=UPI000FE692E3|nr:LysR substrate-binding domain-containing protein [Mesorhizobium sp.]RWI16469.1 MAG: LysR family transcriptional regulator [Mesorhizobium sp.]RWN08497.1 MAG: LysR family transcriptional regulator [Mesorhizobium sp.]RWN08685.1 MAG: LysR family transcriptional regulator [Mesorhizobium sp.]TIQ97587.1 MAG: LysR family transcriptional regulator [Mesorhizobium sp.]